MPPQLHMSYDQISRRAVGGDCCGLPTWKTVFSCDFSAQGSQNLAADGNYNIGGVTWKRENAAHDQAAMVLTNGVGLVISPDQPSDYIHGTRTAPLIWTPLSGIYPAATWSTAFRIWSFSPTDPPLADPGPNGFIYLCGLDSDSMAYSNVGMRGCVAGQAVQGMLARTTIANTSLYNIQQFRLDATNRAFVHLVQPGSVQEVIEGSIYSGAGTWPTPQAVKPRAASVSVADGNMSAVAAPATSLGLVIGAFRAGNVNFQAVTVSAVRVDVREVGP